MSNDSRTSQLAHRFAWRQRRRMSGVMSTQVASLVKSALSTYVSTITRNRKAAVPICLRCGSTRLSTRSTRPSRSRYWQMSTMPNRSSSVVRFPRLPTRAHTPSNYRVLHLGESKSIFQECTPTEDLEHVALREHAYQHHETRADKHGACGLERDARDVVHGEGERHEER